MHKITTPSLIISGDKDLIRLEHTLLIFQNIPKAQLWIVPHSGHGTFIEHTTDFCNVVNTFFNEK
ncbi:MAG: alpha/beta hydrolase [Paludibacteraceae bacterium]